MADGNFPSYPSNARKAEVKTVDAVRLWFGWTGVTPHKCRDRTLPPPFSRRCLMFLTCISLGRSGCEAQGPFDMREFLRDVHPNLVPYFKVLKENGYEDRVTMSTIEVDDCEFCHIPRALARMLIKKAKQLGGDERHDQVIMLVCNANCCG